MIVFQLLDEVRRHVPQHAASCTRWMGTGVVPLPEGVHHITAAARIDAQGYRREQFWCDDVCVEQAMSLRLSCAARECPYAVKVRTQRNAFHSRVVAAARPVPPL